MNAAYVNPYHIQNAKLRQDMSYSPYAYHQAGSPWPTVGGETMDKIKAWLDKPTFPTAQPGSFTAKVQNKHLAYGAGAALVLGLAYKYRRKLFR